MGQYENAQCTKPPFTHFPTDTEFELRRKRIGSVIPKEADLHGAAQALIRYNKANKRA